MSQDSVNEESKIRKIIEERKALKAEEEEKLSLQKEKERREQGKIHQQTLKQMEEKIEQKEAELSEKEKAAERIYQQQLREQVRKEREERQRIESQSNNPVPPPVTETKRTISDSDLTLFRVRLLNGDSIVESFDSKITLGEVMYFLNQKYKIMENYSFRMTFPNKVFTKEDEIKSLLDLNLVPNATLVMTQSEVIPRGPRISTQTSPQATQGQSYIQQTWDYLSSWVYWFLGTNVPPPQQEQPPATGRSSGGSTRGKVNHVHSETEYNSLKNTNDLVIVDVSATWCGPCKKIEPIFEELARGHPSVVFVHVDLDQFKNVLKDLANLRSVPTFLFFKNKQLVTQFSGANQQQLVQTMNRYK